MIKRAFVYGDLLFESMLVQNHQIEHAQKHYERLTKSAQILKMELPDSFDFECFTTAIYNEIQNSSLTDKSNCRVRFILHRNSLGFYLPDSNSTDYFIEVFELPQNWKEMAQKTKKVGIFTEQKKALGPYSNLKTGNALIYVMAKLWAKENGLDDALILNQNGHVIEAASSNIYWKKNNQIYTVPLSEGCIAGVSRQVFIENCALQNTPVVEQICTINDLRNADEILMSNAGSGVCKIELTL
ncbi:MAG: aminotransferase class IV [Bacteroidia bacterium]|nr:aminotransferase class IV [Bacteroidia bacterium]